MNKKFRNILAYGCLAFSMMAMPSCVGDLDMKPNDPNSKTELNSAAEYEGFFYQLYNGLVVSGPQGDSDITVEDGGAGTYMRLLWNLEELPTDETLIGKNWNDSGIDELDFSTWSPDNHWLYEAMSRFTFQINMCNEFIRTIDKAAGMISDDEIAAMKREAIVLRALSYYHLMDNFGKGPFTDENSTVGATPPTLTRAEMFEKIVPQLAETVKDLTPASAQKYGRLSREAGYMLLAKFYLNAEVYTGTARWQDCANACNEILKTINTLAPDYKYLFCADNDRFVGNGEILWGLPQDENNQQTYGGTTYLSIGAYNTNVVTTTQGLQGTGWSGPRVRPELVDMFESGDNRYLISDNGGKLKNNLEDLGDWGADGCGLMCIKYVYTKSNDYYNTTGATLVNTFSGTDYPLFRLADTYLMLAECELNGATGCNGQDNFDKVRARAGLAPILLTKDKLFEERARELYWEGHRRSDMIRFGKFTGSSYKWSWKGGALRGRSIPDYRKVYAIPTKFVPTLGQNEGY